MRSKKHIDYDGLLRLYKYLSLGYPCEKITQLVNKNRTTIYRLIIKNSRWDASKCFAYPGNPRYRQCASLLKCKADGLDRCPHDCPRYEKWVCPILKKFPYICNFCERRNSCKREKRLFNPEEAYVKRMDRLSEAKRTPGVSKEELRDFDDLISPLVKQGISIEAIYSAVGKACPVSSRTARNYINKGYLAAKRIDLRNAVAREYSDSYKYRRIGKNPLLKVDRTWACFQEYMTSRDQGDVTQLDTVHGRKKDRKCILTIHHPSTKFQIGRLLESCSADEVNRQIGEIRSLIGDDYYFKFFRVMLCDNGPEFDQMPDLEADRDTGEAYARVFYTRPYCSGDKGSCERNHELFRYVVPKGKSLDDLTQDDVNFIFSNINSYPRKSLGYQCPVDLANAWVGKDFATKLGILKIPFKQLTFKKKLK